MTFSLVRLWPPLARRRLRRLLGDALRAALARDSEAAVEHLGRAARIAPRDPELRMELAWHLDQLGRREEALEEYRAAARLSPPSSGAAEVEIALLLVAMGDPAAAEAALSRALAREPGLLEEVVSDERLSEALAGRPRFESWRTRAGD